MEWSSKFIAAHYTAADGTPTLRFYRGSWYAWAGTHYAQVTPHSIRKQLYEFLGKAKLATAKGIVPFKPAPGTVNATLEVTMHALLLEARIEPPFVIQKDGAYEPMRGAIMLRNGRLDVTKRELVSHVPQVFALNCLPFEYHPNAPTPKRWRAFLEELWPGDDHKQERTNLQKLFGLLLTPDTSLQKIFMIVGPKRSGKGTIGRVLVELLGKDNVVSPTMQGLASHFGLWPLIDKTVAIVSDARLPASAGRVTERLLSISGEELDHRRP